MIQKPPSLGISHFLKAIKRYEAGQRAYLLCRLITLLNIRRLRMGPLEQVRAAEREFLSDYKRFTAMQSQRFQ